jgi:hypothetical protein
MTRSRNLQSLRNTKRKPAARRARLEVTHLEDRVVPSTLTGMSFVEQQGFPTPQATVFSNATLFQDQLNQTWQNILSGSQLLNGKTLQQQVTDSIQQAAQQQGVGAYNISDSFAASGDYSAQLDTSGANPVLSVQYHLGGNTLDFTNTTNSVAGSWADPTFHVSYDLTLYISLTIPSHLSPTSAVSVSAQSANSNVTVSSNNVIVGLAQALMGKNITGSIANGVAAQQQDLSSMVPAGLLNSLLDAEAGKGYTRLQAGLDGNGNLQLTGQLRNLAVNGSSNDHIVVSVTANGGVQVTAGGQTGTFAPGSLQSITINSAYGQNSIQILAVPSGVSVNVTQAHGGTDSVTVGNGSLASVGGPVSVSNTSGKTALTIDDSTDAADSTATLTNGSVQFAGMSPVSYSGNVTSLQVKGGSGSDTFSVTGTASGTPVAIVTGVGLNKVYVGSGSLANIAAGVNVQANASGQTSLIVDDYQESGRSATVTGSSVSFTGVPAITYSNITSLGVVGSGGWNTVTVASVPSGVPVTIYNTQHNYVWGPAASTVIQSWNLPLWDLPLGSTPPVFHHV